MSLFLAAQWFRSTNLPEELQFIQDFFIRNVFFSVWIVGCWEFAVSYGRKKNEQTAVEKKLFSVAVNCLRHRCMNFSSLTNFKSSERNLLFSVHTILRNINGVLRTSRWISNVMKELFLRTFCFNKFQHRFDIMSI